MGVGIHGIVAGRLQFRGGNISEYSCHVRDDQVGALVFDASIWVDGCGDCGAGDSVVAGSAVDLRGAGSGAVGGDGVQPAGGCADRCDQSADADAGTARWIAYTTICGMVHRGQLATADAGGVAVEPACAVSLTGGAGDCVCVLVYEAIHAMGSPVSWTGDGNCSGGGLGSGPRRYRSEDIFADWGSDVLGRRIRCAV